jgi:selenocysteine-specific elongation factor
MGTAGHVDHGKTALIKALTGIDCDTHKEEKERGITINLGFSHLELPSGNSIGIVDVPGHKDFIKTMVAGAYGIDLVLLVVAADSGIMPQTTEHFNIIRMLGIKHGIVVLNKTDLVDEEMLELAKFEIMEFLEKTPFKDAPIIGVSSLTGSGIPELTEQIDRMVSIIPERKTGNIFRLYIDRIFNIKGHGLVVTGSVLNGAVETGDELFLLPGRNDRLKIRSIERHGKTVQKVVAGERAALNLSGLKFIDFERGMLLSNRDIAETALLDAQLKLFENDVRLGVWSQVIFHTGTFNTKARIHLIDKDLVQGGEEVIVQIHLEKPAILLNKDKFIIRNSSNDLTLGGGTIVDVSPLHHRRRTQKLSDSLRQVVNAILSQENMLSLIELELKKEGRPLFAHSLASSLDIEIGELVEICSTEGANSILMYDFQEGKLLVSAAFEQALAEKIVEEITLHHQKNQIFEDGPEQKEMAGKLNFKSATELKYLDLLIKKMLGNSILKKSGKTLALQSHRAKIDPKMQEQIDWLEKTILDFGMQKTSYAELETLALKRNPNKGLLKMLLNYLVKKSRIFYDGEDVIHQTMVESARQKLLKTLAAKANGINEKEFRELIGGTKKIVQVLIDLFIDEGIIEKRTFYLMITEEGRDYLG